MALLIVVGFFYLDPRSFSFGPPPGSAAFSSAMLLLVYAYTGFEIAVIPSGEIRDPGRDLPFAILTAIGVVAVFYILIQVVCIGSLPGLSLSDRPLADAARRFLGQPGATIISGGAVVSILGNLNVVLRLFDQADLLDRTSSGHLRVVDIYRAIPDHIELPRHDDCIARIA